MGFFNHLFLKNRILNNNAFIWDSKKKTFKSIENVQTIEIDLIIGVDRQKKTLLDNTKNFSIGNFTNNALLWGVRGNGKSTLIKSIFSILSKKK